MNEIWVELLKADLNLILINKNRKKNDYLTEEEE